MQCDMVEEVLLHLHINDIKTLATTEQTFNRVLTSSHFWEKYFNQHVLLFENKKYNTVKQWIDFYILTLAQKIVDHMKQGDILITKLIEISFINTLLTNIKNFVSSFPKEFKLGILYNYDYVLNIGIAHRMAETHIITKEDAVKYVNMLLYHQMIVRSNNNNLLELINHLYDI